MLHSHALRAGLRLLALALAGCASTPPSPLPDDHPASVHAPTAPVQREPSALAGYRDFGAGAVAAPADGASATGQPAHPQHRHAQPGDQEGAHATPQ